MANQLKMAMIQAILTLRARRWSLRRIARELGVHRETVSRYVRLAESKLATAPIDRAPIAPAPVDAAPTNSIPLGGEADEVGAPAPPAPADVGELAGLPLGRDGGGDAVAAAASSSELPCPGLPFALPLPEPRPSPSRCEPWRETIVAKLAAGLSAQRVYQDLVAEHGFAGSYYSVRRFVRKLAASQPLPFRRMECAPGE